MYRVPKIYLVLYISAMARSQQQRKAETRRLLLDAAAELFAAQGVDAVSLEAIADRAGRTTGAVYAHFGGKEGLLSALVDSWTGEAAAVIAAEIEVSDTLTHRLDALWRNFVGPPADDAWQWVLLEHELWLAAARRPEIRDGLAARYAAFRQQLAPVAAAWAEDADGGGAEQRAALVIALLLGLEMQHRLDPTAVTDDTAIAGLRAVLAPAAVDRREDERTPHARHD